MFIIIYKDIINEKYYSPFDTKEEAIDFLFKDPNPIPYGIYTIEELIKPSKED